MVEDIIADDDNNCHWDCADERLCNGDFGLYHTIDQDYWIIYQRYQISVSLRVKLANSYIVFCERSQRQYAIFISYMLLRSISQSTKLIYGHVVGIQL